MEKLFLTAIELFVFMLFSTLMACETEHPEPDNQNPYFPLKVGNKWEFLTDNNEVKIIEILSQNGNRYYFGEDTATAVFVVDKDKNVFYGNKLLIPFQRSNVESPLTTRLWGRVPNFTGIDAFYSTSDSILNMWFYGKRTGAGYSYTLEVNDDYLKNIGSYRLASSFYMSLSSTYSFDRETILLKNATINGKVYKY